MESLPRKREELRRTDGTTVVALEARCQISDTVAQGFLRTVLGFTPGETVISVDVTAKDGSRLCRLNIFDWGSGYGAVDVIVQPDRQRIRALAWEAGTPVLSQALEGCLLAADITRR